MTRTSLSGYYSKAMASLQEGTLTVNTANAVFNCTSPYDFDIQLATVSKFKYDSSADKFIISSANIDLDASGNLDIIGDLTAATITMTGFSVGATGATTVLSLNASSGGITNAGAISGATSIACTSQVITLAAGGEINIIAASHTGTGGILDIDVATVGADYVSVIDISVDANGYTGICANAVALITGALGAGEYINGFGVDIAGNASSDATAVIHAFNAVTDGVGGIHCAFYTDVNFDYALMCNDAPIVGSAASGGDLLLISTTHATKGDIQFHSASYYITSTGALTVGAITGTTLALSGTITGASIASSQLTGKTETWDGIDVSAIKYAFPIIGRSSSGANSIVYASFWDGGSGSTTTATEANAQVAMNACVVKGIKFNVSTNIISSGNLVVTLRKNGADTDITVTVGAGVTGQQTASGSAVFADGDLLSVEFDGTGNDGTILVLGGIAACNVV